MHPYLSHIFDHEQSIFVACTVSTCYHCNHLNLGPGACPIFAISDFDHTKGSHLVLWDLKLVIKFSLGSLIIILSALLKHSNVPIRKDTLFIALYACYSLTFQR